MKKIIAVMVGTLFLAGMAFAQVPTKPAGRSAAGTSTDTGKPGSAATSSCEARAVDKNGKPLAGAAKASFMKKCEGNGQAAATSCESKAVGKNGKPLTGAAKSSFMKKCLTSEGK